MNCNMPGFSVLHYLLEFAQTHVHWVSDAIQPFHPLLSPSPPFPVSWFYASGGQSIGASASAPVLSMNIWGWFPLGGMNGLERIRENGYIYMYAWVPLLSTWNYQNIVNWLYSNAKQKVKKHRIVDLKYISMYFINWFLTKVSNSIRKYNLYSRCLRKKYLYAKNNPSGVI